MPRKPADLAAYEMAVKPNPVREWELTNTRYLLALAVVMALSLIHIFCSATSTANASE